MNSYDSVFHPLKINFLNQRYIRVFCSLFFCFMFSCELLNPLQVKRNFSRPTYIHHIILHLQIVPFWQIAAIELS